MSKTCAFRSPKSSGRAKTGALPSDLYAYAKAKPLSRIGGSKSELLQAP